MMPMGVARALTWHPMLQEVFKSRPISIEPL